MNKNFENWFSGSNVINEHQEPMVFYHGTSAVFESFCHTKKGSNTG